MDERKAMINTEYLVPILAALASPLRLRILEELKKQPRYVSELACVLNITQGQATKHLQILSDARLVECEQSFRTIPRSDADSKPMLPRARQWYRLVPGTMGTITQELKYYEVPRRRTKKRGAA
jgi:DNA-binding transcriptional ArsR family regulator